eukprot:8575543-Lingulodinium_polyedra.AAC.1
MSYELVVRTAHGTPPTDGPLARSSAILGPPTSQHNMLRRLLNCPSCCSSSPAGAKRPSWRFR